MMCSWWKRWYHARLRTADVEAVWTTIIALAKTETQAREAWEEFLAQPGQEHWRCPCGEDLYHALRSVLFHVEANSNG